MKNPFQIGDRKIYGKIVAREDTAGFFGDKDIEGGGTIHPFYSTFALARDVEWACRLFVLEMKQEDEEGIGTKINIDHLSPALAGNEVEIIATLTGVNGNSVICSFEVFCGSRLIAKGSQEQKILKKDKVKRLFNSLK